MALLREALYTVSIPTYVTFEGHVYVFEQGNIAQPLGQQPLRRLALSVSRVAFAQPSGFPSDGISNQALRVRASWDAMLVGMASRCSPTGHRWSPA